MSKVVLSIFAIPKMKRCCLFLFICMCYLASAQEVDTLPGSWKIGARMQYGFVISHRPTIVHLQQDHTKALEVELVHHLCGDEDWQQTFLLPAYSIAYQYIDLGNEKELGIAHAMTGRILFPLNKNKMISTSIGAGFGIGYIEKKYERYENFKNVAIGSHINAVVSFSFRAAIKTGRLSSADLGFSFTHFSNGSFRPPNLGLNIPALQVGYSHYIGSECIRTHRPVKPIEKKSINKITVTGGIKGVEMPYGLNMYGIAALAYTRSRIISPKSRLGLGVDGFYDRSLVPKLSFIEKEEVSTSICYRAGINLGYELTAGRVTMLIQNGVYVFDEYEEDGNFYTKVGVDYQLSEKMIACFHLKSHFGRADYFEYGLGYIF